MLLAGRAGRAARGAHPSSPAAPPTHVSCRSTSGGGRPATGRACGSWARRSGAPTPTVGLWGVACRQHWQGRKRGYVCCSARAGREGREGKAWAAAWQAREAECGGGALQSDERESVRTLGCASLPCIPASHRGRPPRPRPVRRRCCGVPTPRTRAGARPGDTWRETWREAINIEANGQPWVERSAHKWARSNEVGGPYACQRRPLPCLCCRAS